MLGKFDDGFYRNKRAALASSLALIVASTISISLRKDAILFNVFQVGEDAPYILIVVVLLMICLYLNVSYFLHYFTEIPRWLKEPSGELQEVENLSTLVIELKWQLDRQSGTFSDAIRRHDEAMTTLAGQLKIQIPYNFGSDIEQKILERLKYKSNIYKAVSSEIGQAVSGDPPNPPALQENTDYETITKRAIEGATRELNFIISSEVGKVLAALDRRLALFIEGAEKMLLEIREKETELLRETSATNEKIEMTARKLRQWSTLMHFRTTIWYAYFAMAIFGIAVLSAAFSIWFGRPAIHWLFVSFR